MSEHTSFGWDVGPGEYGLRGIIARPHKSMAGNLILEVGEENTSNIPGWHKVAHVVLTPADAAALHAAIGEQIGVRPGARHAGGRVPPVTEAEAPGASPREARQAAARAFAATLGVDGDELIAAAEAAWSNMNPQSTLYASALSVAGVALRAARQVRDQLATAQPPPGDRSPHHEHRPAAASITDRRGVAVLKGSRPEQYPLFGACRDCAHRIVCMDSTADWSDHPAIVQRALDNRLHPGITYPPTSPQGGNKP